MKVTNGAIDATIDELDNSRWTDREMKRSILFTFHSKDTLVIDICDGIASESHDDCNLLQSIKIKL